MNILKKSLILVFILFLLSGCINSAKEESKNEKVNVIVSILPQKTFVKEVGGDNVNVSELIPKGASPATYEPKPSDLIKVENADIYFRIGYIPFEKANIGKLKSLNKKMKVIDTSKNVKLRHFLEEEEYSHEEEEDHLGENETEIDPHIWLSPIQVKSQVDEVAKALSEKDSKNKDEYYNNAKEFKAKLDSLNKKIKEDFEGLNAKTIMTFHPSWGYFANEYNLKQISIEQDGKEPTSEKLQHLIDKAREEKIKVIFVQSQFNKEIANSIAEEINAIVISVDPLSEDYLANLESISKVISENLEK